MTARECVSQTAQLWRDMSEEAKRPYVAQADLERARYTKERTLFVAETSTTGRKPRFNKRRKKDACSVAAHTKVPQVANVKRVTPPYIFFCNQQRSRVVQRQPTWRMADVSKELGRMWRSLSDAEREPCV